METTYLVCAIVGGTLITCQFIMTLLGLGGDHDVGGHDVPAHDFHAGSHDASHGNESSWFFGLLTFRTLSAGVAFFGLTGLIALQAEAEPILALLLALGSGIAALFLVGWIMQTISRLNADGTTRIERSVGSRGTVYLTVPGARAGTGKVHVSLDNRTIECKAVTTRETLATGTKIVVVAVVNPDTLEVALATD